MCVALRMERSSARSAARSLAAATTALVVSTTEVSCAVTRHRAAKQLARTSAGTLYAVCSKTTGERCSCEHTGNEAGTNRHSARLSAASSLRRAAGCASAAPAAISASGTSRSCATMATSSEASRFDGTRFSARSAALAYASCPRGVVTSCSQLGMSCASEWVAYLLCN